MDAFEKAIRSAFEKGDPRERAFREKVYRSAFAALDRALQANQAITPEMAARRRQAVLDTITSIETEFIPAVEPAAGPAEPAPPAGYEVRLDDDAPRPVRNAGGDRREPSFGPQPGRDDIVHPATRSDDFDDAIEPPHRGYEPPRRRAWVALAAVAAVLVTAGAAAWWLTAPSARDPAPPRPPLAAEDDDFSPAEPGQPLRLADGDDLDDWVVIFDPSDPTTVTTPGDSRAAVMEDDGDRFIRIGSGTSGAAVLFDVGRGVLEQIAGRRVVFNIVARTEEGQSTQISVDCSLGELGDCGRKRYVVGATREEFLFEMALPAVSPGAGGAIAINSDVENGGRSVDIFTIRVSPSR